MDNGEKLALKLDQECLRQLGSLASATGISLDELVSAILREALKRLEEQGES